MCKYWNPTFFIKNKRNKKHIIATICIPFSEYRHAFYLKYLWTLWKNFIFHFLFATALCWNSFIYRKLFQPCFHFWDIFTLANENHFFIVFNVRNYCLYVDLQLISKHCWIKPMGFKTTRESTTYLMQLSKKSQDLEDELEIKLSASRALWQDFSLQAWKLHNCLVSRYLFSSLNHWQDYYLYLCQR